MPTVKDFVRLLQNHAKSSHVFIHQALKNGKELSEWYHEYAIHAISQYKQQQPQQMNSQTEHGKDAKTAAAAGDFTSALNWLISSLQDETDRRECLEQIDAHASFLDFLAQRSKKSMDVTVRASLASPQDNATSSPNKEDANAVEEKGSPGIFLLKWQHFINATPITPGPGPNDGKPRTGKSRSAKDQSAMDVEGNSTAAAATASGPGNADEKEELEPPDVSHVLQMLGPGFREELRRLVDVRKGEGE